MIMKFLNCIILLGVSSCYSSTGSLLIKDFSLSLANYAPTGCGWIETENDKYRIIACNVLREKYKVHLNDLRRKRENVSQILKWNSWRYTDTVSDTIISEIARCFLNINGGVVSYNKFDGNVLECCRDNGNVFIDPKHFTSSNWNYLLLVNVINRALYYRHDFNERLIDRVASYIQNARFDKIHDNLDENKESFVKSHFSYEKYESQLKRATYDIKQYFKELDLYSFLNDLRKIRIRISKKLSDERFHKLDNYEVKELTDEAMKVYHKEPSNNEVLEHYFHKNFENNIKALCDKLEEERTTTKDFFHLILFEFLHDIERIGFQPKKPMTIKKSKEKNLGNILDKTTIDFYINDINSYINYNVTLYDNRKYLWNNLYFHKDNNNEAMSYYNNVLFVADVLITFAYIYMGLGLQNKYMDKLLFVSKYVRSHYTEEENKKKYKFVCPYLHQFVLYLELHMNDIEELYKLVNNIEDCGDLNYLLENYGNTFRREIVKNCIDEEYNRIVSQS